MFEIDEEQKEEANIAKDGRKNVVRKHQIQVAEAGKPGDIVHYHAKENETEKWDEPCYWVKHRIHDRAGIKLNDKIYAGEVVVPQCTADYLAWQESAKAEQEAALFRSKTVKQIAGVY